MANKKSYPYYLSAIRHDGKLQEMWRPRASLKASLYQANRMIGKLFVTVVITDERTGRSWKVTQ